MCDAAEMRRRWSDKPATVLSGQDFHEEYVYGPSNRELDLDFQDCRSIVFMDGEGRRGGLDLLLMASGSGHVTLPKGVQVRVVAGKVKVALDEASGSSADSVVGSSYGGYRAPPPTRASSYAGSSASSAYSSARASQASASTYRPNPPRTAADASRAGSHVGTLANARRVPLPASVINEPNDWVVQEECEGAWDLDSGSVHPNDSVSAVGARDRY